LGEVFNEMMSENFSGTERVGNVMAFWANTKDEFPQVEAFPSGANTQLLDTLQNLTTKNITIATKVPAILANIHEGVSLGGDGNTIESAVKLMQQRAAKWQAILEANYTRIFDNWYEAIQEDIEIVDHNPFPSSQTVDPQVWEFLNPETKKKWIQDNTNIEIVEPVNQPLAPQPTNLLYNSYPEGASKNAKKAIDWNELNKSCGSKMGWEIAQSIAEKKPISYKTVKRIKNYLSKNEIEMNKPFNESCNAVLFYAWGGKDMLKWALDKINEVEG